MRTIYSKEEVAKLINEGKTLLIAGDEKLFEGLPKGNWIGGRIPYFMGDDGGVITKESLLVTELPEQCKVSSIGQYSAQNLEKVTEDYPENGVSFIIIPAASETHNAFSKQATTFSKLFNSPLMGWISGPLIEEFQKVPAVVFNGKTGTSSQQDAVVMHVDLPQEYYAKIDIINLFTQGDGDSIEFEEEEAMVSNALINGERVNLADYLAEKKINLQLPMVANYSGAMINVSFLNVDFENRVVQFASPIFKGVEYKIANPVDDYEKDFEAELKKLESPPIYACNCILNFLFAGLEGKKTGYIKGPMTFGEIAYMLLNQTMVYVTLGKK